MPQTTIAGIGTTTRSGSGSVALAEHPLAFRPWLLLLGDSKTEGDTWPAALQASVTPPPFALVNVAAPGTNVGSTAAIIGTVLAPAVLAETPTVLINLGVNDMGSYTTDAFGPGWRTNYLIILDAIRARWPAAPIYLTKPWMRTKNSQADLMAGWIDILITLRANLFVGTDERGFYKGADDGATNTSDGVHPSLPAGENAIMAAWKAVLWP